jgi:hypothetical protein
MFLYINQELAILNISKLILDFNDRLEFTLMRSKLVGLGRIKEIDAPSKQTMSVKTKQIYSV